MAAEQPLWDAQSLGMFNDMAQVAHNTACENVGNPNLPRALFSESVPYEKNKPSLTILDESQQPPVIHLHPMVIFDRAERLIQSTTVRGVERSAVQHGVSSAEAVERVVYGTVFYLGVQVALQGSLAEPATSQRKTIEDVSFRAMQAWNDKQQQIRLTNMQGGDVETESEELLKARRELFRRSLKGKERDLYAKVLKSQIDIRDELNEARKNREMTAEDAFAMILQRSLAAADTLTFDLGRPAGSYPWQVMSIPRWLLRPLSVKDIAFSAASHSQLTTQEAVYKILNHITNPNRPITFHDILYAVRRRVITETELLSHEERSYKRSFIELTAEEYALLTVFLGQQILAEERDGHAWPISSVYLLRLVQAVNFSLFEWEFSKKQPVVFSPHLLYPDKRKRQEAYKVTAAILNAMIYETEDAIADDDDPKHDAARLFLTRLEQVPKAQEFLANFGPPHYDREWLLSLISLSQETADPWFTQVAQRYMQRLQTQEVRPLFYAHELNSIFIQTEPQDLESLNGQIRSIHDRLDTHEFGFYRKFDINTDTLAAFISDQFQIKEARSRWMWFGNNLDMILTLEDESGHQFTFSATLTKNQPLESLFVNIVDVENIPLSLKIHLANIIAQTFNQEMSALEKTKQAEAETKKDQSARGVLYIPATRDRGVARTMAKDTKRKKAPVDPQPSAPIEPVTEYWPKRPRLILTDQDRLNLAHTFGDQITSSIFNSIALYENGGGRFRLLRQTSGSHGKPLLSLRAGNYRLLFDITSVEHQAVLVAAIHRRDLVEKLREFIR